MVPEGDGFLTRIVSVPWEILQQDSGVIDWCGVAEVGTLDNEICTEQIMIMVELINMFFLTQILEPRIYE